jgi:hypothetical protein
MQTGRLTPWNLDSPAATWYFCFFFTKMLHEMQHFCEKEMESSALPEPALSVVEWGDIPRQTRNRRIPVSIGRFAGFAHVELFVVQTSTAYVVYRK